MYIELVYDPEISSKIRLKILQVLILSSELVVKWEAEVSPVVHYLHRAGALGNALLNWNPPIPNTCTESGAVTDIACECISLK